MTSPRKFFLSLAVLALVMNISIHIMPAVSALTGNTLITICSSYGTRTITINKNGNEVPPPPKYAQKNCSICLIADANTLIPSNTTLCKAPDLTSQSIAIHKESNERKIISKSTNQSRAPPQFS